MQQQREADSLPTTDNMTSADASELSEETQGPYGSLDLQGRRLAAENATYAEIGRIISSSPDIQEVYQGFAEEVRRLIPFDRLVISSVDLESETMATLYYAGVPIPDWTPGKRIPMSDSPTGWVAKIGRGLVLGGEELKRRFPSQAPSLARGLNWLVAVPLISKNEVIGSIHFRSKSENGYCDNDLEIAGRVASQIAGTVANARLYAKQVQTQKALEASVEEAKRLAQENALIADIGRIISSSLNINEVYEGFAAAVRKLIQLDRIAISILNRKGETLTNTYVFGSEVEGRSLNSAFSYKGSPIEEALRSRSSVLAQGTEAELKKRYPAIAISGTRSIIMAPLMHKNEIVGFFSVRSVRLNAYTQRDVNLVTQVADQIAPAIVNSQMYAEQSRLASFAMHNPNPIIEANLDGEITYCNQEAEAQFPDLRELGAEHPIIADLTLVISELWPGEREFLSRDVQVGDKTYQQRVLYLPQVGQIRIYSSDITPRTRAQDELSRKAELITRVNSELQELAHIASHDLQEPLGAIAGFAQLLSERYQDKLDETAHEFIGYVLDGSSQMQIILNGLLDYTRVCSEGNELESIDCSAVAQQAISNLQSQIQEHDAFVTCDNLPHINGNQSHMVQLFQNLIDNAIKFHSSERPRIHVSCTIEDDAWKFSVIDNGIGVGQQNHQRIMGMFKRSHGREDFPGIGMGLALCNKIVDRHGGRIWVDSELGNGATFNFTLPITTA